MIVSPRDEILTPGRHLGRSLRPSSSRASRAARRERGPPDREPVPVGSSSSHAVVASRDDAAVPVPQLHAHRFAAVLQRVLEQFAENEGERRGLVAGERNRFQSGLDALSRTQSLDEHRAESVDQLIEIDVVVTAFGQHLVYRGDRQDRSRSHRALPRIADVERALASLERQSGVVVTRGWISCAGRHALLPARVLAPRLHGSRSTRGAHAPGR